MAPPLYVMILQSLEKNAGIKLLEDAIARIEEVLKQKGGNLVIKMKVIE